jgi:chromosome segregation ATPase
VTGNPPRVDLLQGPMELVLADVDDYGGPKSYVNLFPLDALEQLKKTFRAFLEQIEERKGDDEERERNERDVVLDVLVEAVDRQIQARRDAIAEIESRQAQIEAKRAPLLERLAEIRPKIARLEARQAELPGLITEKQQDLEAVQGLITQNQTDVEFIGRRIEAEQYDKDLPQALRDMAAGYTGRDAVSLHYNALIQEGKAEEAIEYALNSRTPFAGDVRKMIDPSGELQGEDFERAKQEFIQDKLQPGATAVAAHRAGADTRIQALESDLEGLRAQREALEARQKDIQDQIEALQQEQTQNAKELAALKAEEAKISAQLEKLDQEYNALEAQKGELQGELDALNREKGALMKTERGAAAPAAQAAPGAGESDSMARMNGDNALREGPWARNAHNVCDGTTAVDNRGGQLVKLENAPDAANGPVFAKMATMGMTG